MFNSPLQYCPGCKQYVELDQTRAECAEKHGCKDVECPLAKQFAPPAPTDDKPPPTTNA
jgi:hypothetical protein